jgi:hypothetical protein
LNKDDYGILGSDGITVHHVDTRIPFGFLRELVSVDSELKDGEGREWISRGGDRLVAVKRTGICTAQGLNEPYHSYDFVYNPED